jgi:hypothetical protein
MKIGLGESNLESYFRTNNMLLKQTDISSWGLGCQGSIIFLPISERKFNTTAPLFQIVKVKDLPPNPTSYCRKVPSQWTSNQKIKGKANKKNGNEYLAWAFSEAAELARRYDKPARAYYNKKSTRTNFMTAHTAPPKVWHDGLITVCLINLTLPAHFPAISGLFFFEIESYFSFRLNRGGH